MQWSVFLKNKYSRNEFIISVVLLLITLFAFTKFLNFNENRAGTTLADPVLHFFNAVDLTWLIFCLIYISLVLVLVNLLANPGRLVFTIQCYVLLLLIRMLMMYLMPLNPPEGMIALNDPFVQAFGTGQVLTKDLFFSGHTATIFLFYLVSNKKTLKIFFLSVSVLVAAAVMLQHVHYAVDVVSAPFFSYLSYRLVYLFRTKKLNLSLRQM